MALCYSSFYVLRNKIEEFQNNCQLVKNCKIKCSLKKKTGYFNKQIRTFGKIVKFMKCVSFLVASMIFGCLGKCLTKCLWKGKMQLTSDVFSSCLFSLTERVQRHQSVCCRRIGSTREWAKANWHPCRAGGEAPSLSHGHRYGAQLHCKQFWQIERSQTLIEFWKCESLKPECSAKLPWK